MIRPRLAAAAAIAALCALSACTNAVRPPTRESAQPVTLRLVSQVDLATLDPLAAPPGVGADLDALVFGYLFDVDEKLAFVPDLATAVPTQANGGISRDGLTITYALRHGVRWQDGTAFTAADVVATERAIANPKNDVSSRAGWDDIAGVEAVGDYEVRFHLKKIYAPAIATYFCEGGFPVLPAHLLGPGDTIDASHWAKPIGTGPFDVVRWQPGIGVELAANPAYWRGRPKLDAIDYETIADPSPILDGLRARTIDAWLAVPSDDVPEARALPFDRIQTAPSLTYTHLDLNQKDPLFDDVRVRRAIDLAIDRKAIVDGPLRGLADTAAADVSPVSWAYDPNAKPPRYDPALARRLLADAGWTPGPDGVLRKGDQRLSFSVVSATGARTSTAVVAALRAQLATVGISIAPQGTPAGRLFAPYDRGGVLYRGDFDAALFAWVAGIDPDDSAEYMCNMIPPAGQNDLYWCDDALDAAERGALSTYDRSARQRYENAIQEELASQAVTVVLYFDRQVLITSPALRGLRPSPSGINTWNAWEWSL